MQIFFHEIYDIIGLEELVHFYTKRGVVPVCGQNTHPWAKRKLLGDKYNLCDKYHFRNPMIANVHYVRPNVNCIQD